MRALAQRERVRLQVAAGSAGQIGVDFGEDAVGIVESLVNVGEKQMNVAKVGVEANGVERAALRLGNVARGVLHKTEAVFSGGGVRLQRKPVANKHFRLGIFAAAVKDHGEAKERRSIGGFGGVDGALKIFAGLVQVAEFVMRDSEIVVGAVVVGRQVRGGLQILEAGLWVTFDKKLAALFESANGFARHGELLDGNHCGCRGGVGRRKLGEARQRGRKYEKKRKEKL